MANNARRLNANGIDSSHRMRRSFYSRCKWWFTAPEAYITQWAVKYCERQR